MDIAKKTFELNNQVKVVDAIDDVFRYSRAEERALEEQAPWKDEQVSQVNNCILLIGDSPNYFQTVRISAVALIKMVTHARSGGDYEIMGVMYGKVRDHTFWIMDAAALPVQGTETRVNAGNEALEYMVNFQMTNEVAGKGESLRGWYHSHPGYGCWLSGIDVNTQMTNQTHNDPYLAVVIDPNRTVSAGKVEIGAFRTYPEACHFPHRSVRTLIKKQGYTPSVSSSSQYQSIPMDKIEDFGVHANAYYPLKVEVYKTKLDEQLLELLWNKYWVATLSQSLIVSNRAYATSQITDLTAKLKSAAHTLGESRSTPGLKLKSGPLGKGQATAVDNKEETGKQQAEYAGVEEQETSLSKAARDSIRITTEAQSGMIAQVLKDRLFNTPSTTTLDERTASAAARGII
ncbi:MAG: COP9 signalosome catalytic subunit rri1 [Tremellales sp. Tagirdzhanova-0007]|nr:MAG: COP9 signalosome catalytic subunit rri1 [Tremellales sp. Tagirdzhanova-0007]